ncbi:MAG: condensation domain-containing protein, partial [Psychrosphaera sp.]|nr:condensation domain-containing protein [Psychrosphaera sp.]
LGIYHWGGARTLRLSLEGHGREALSDTVDLSQTIGWFTSVYPLTLSLDDGSLEQLIGAVKESYRAIPNNGIGFGVLKHLSGDATFAAMPATEMVFNYLGQFDQVINDNTHFANATEPRGEEYSSARKATHGLSLNGMVIAGQLEFTLSYQQSRYHTSAMQTLMDEIAQALETIVDHCVTTQHGRYTPADFELAQVSQQELTLWQLDDIGPEIEDLYPATGMQQGLLFHSLLSSGSYVTQMLLRFEQLDVACFKQAWLAVVQRHSIFRTAFIGLDQANVHQLVYKAANLPWLEQDLSHFSQSEQIAQVALVQQQDKLQDFAPLEAPMMRMTLLNLGAGHYQLLWSHHHALLDGWCLGPVFAEVTECYRALTAQAPAPAQLNSVAPYRDYVQWLAQQNRPEAEAFWQASLADIVGPTPLPLVQGYGEHGVKEAHTVSLRFDTEQTGQLSALAQSTRSTMNVVLQAAWGLLLSRYSGEQKVVFGAVTSGRPGDLAGAEQMIGLFINTLPVVLAIDNSQTVTDYLQMVHQQLVERERFSYLPLSDIQRLSAAPQGLYESLLVFENYPVNEAIGQHAARA